jgi:PA14 domain
VGWVLRRQTDKTNPTLPGGVYGLFITAGLGVYWRFDGSRTRFILFISDGGRYGMDALTELSYKGAIIPTTDYKFHPGTFPKQITPFQISTVNFTTDFLTVNAHPYSNNDAVRFRNRSGKLPAGLSAEIKYWVVNKTTNTFQLSSTDSATTTTLVDLTDAGTGTHFIWKADAGFDDINQGLPTFCPETQTVFSGICYAEGLLPSAYSSDTEPDWGDFRVVGSGRKLMNYDAAGAELGLISGGNSLLRNPALCALDCLVADYAKPLSRIDFASLVALKTSAPTLVWQRLDPSESGTGWLGKYYTYTGSPPPDISTATLVLTRRDSVLWFDITSTPPGGVNPEYYAATWETHLKFKYGEAYTFKVTRDDGAKIYFNGTLVYDHWTTTTATDDPFTFTATANQIVAVKVEYYNGGGVGGFIFKWQSASLPLEVVPMESCFDTDQQIPRYEFSGAAASPVEAYEYFERIMKRCPGWDWTDKNGKITFLPPDRPIVFEFNFDALDDDVNSTFTANSFQKKLIHRRERRNFALFSYRNQNLSGFPEEFVEENRPRLRELGNGTPNNDPPSDLMVMNRGLAQRIAAREFSFTTDTTHTIGLEAEKDAGVVTKSAFVRVRNLVEGDKRIEDAICLAKIVNRQGNKLVFELFPVSAFYTDEVV